MSIVFIGVPLITVPLITWLENLLPFRALSMDWLKLAFREGFNKAPEVWKGSLPMVHGHGSLQAAAL